MKPENIIAALLVIVSLSSCAAVQKRYLYSATPAVSPAFKEKGEAFVSGYFATTDAPEDDEISGGGGVTAQAGYAFSKNFAVVGALNYSNQRSHYRFNADPFDESKVNYNRNDVILAFDYFTVSKRGNSGWNLLMGASFGKVKMDDTGMDIGSGYDRHFYANSVSFFFQPTLNIYMGDQFALNLDTKMNYVIFNNKNTNYSKEELSTLRLSETPSMFLPELGIKFSWIPERFPLGIDLQYNQVLKNPAEYNIVPTSYSVGVTYHIKKKKK